MKKILIALSLLMGLGFNQAYAQKTKVLEHQPKKKPAWVNTLVKDYVITVGTGSSKSRSASSVRWPTTFRRGRSTH